MNAITNSAPSVPSFDALYAKMLPHFHYFANRMQRRYKGVDFDDIIQELTGWALPARSIRTNQKKSRWDGEM